MVRFPEGMRGKLKDQAARNGRSLNAEIVARLDESFGRRSSSDPGLDMLMNDIKHYREQLREMQNELAEEIYAMRKRRLETDKGD